MLLQHVMMKNDVKHTKNVLKVCIFVTNDVTPVYDDEKQVKANKECAENELVAKDVNSVHDEVRGNRENESEVVVKVTECVREEIMSNEADNEPTKDKNVTKDVTPVCDDGKRNKAHKECAEKTAPIIISPVRNPNLVRSKYESLKVFTSCQVVSLAGRA